MAISDRRKIAAALVLAASGIGLVGVSSGATFSSTVTGSFTVQADFPPTPTATATATTEPTPGKSDDPETESPKPTDSATAGPTPTTTLTPRSVKLKIDPDDNSNWSTDNDTVCTYKNEIKVTNLTARKLGVFTASNTGDADLTVAATVTLPSTLSGKVTAEIRLVKGTAALKADPKGKGKGDSATYEFWLTPKTSGYTISKDEAKNIKVTFVATAV
ncbi:hypothetical protein ACFV5G_31595 [Streptomyces sp. NPDC059766]|uniref:hypothetical protein n=1 Tax=Streptomyces sp. NPDC059766 TaxID=3346940 RepID=UPI0036680DE1